MSNDTSDSFGNRMKDYEKEYTSYYVPIYEILCVRLDGKGFSKFTKGFKKPFDNAITDVMIETTKLLVKETKAQIAFTQSDEITLIFTPGENASEYLFGGKISKINSVLASMCTAVFNNELSKVCSVDKFAFFDCRTWCVPNLVEASNVLLWRAQDARKNSVSCAFRWNLGHKKMQNLSGKQMIEQMKDAGIIWEDLPSCWKYGTFVGPVEKCAVIPDDVYFRIPEKHRPIILESKRKSIEDLKLDYYGDLTLEERVNLISK
jgi:tRNA(His) guanylyltransferase